jgi:carbon monoxide dehydrogenase subunit G
MLPNWCAGVVIGPRGGTANRATWRLPLAVLFCLFALSGREAFCVEPAVAVAVGRSGDAFIVDATIDVQVPPVVAWDVLTDFDRMTSILQNLQSSKVTSRDGNVLIVRQEGVAKYGLLAFSFVSERQIRLEPMQRILARSLSGTLKRMESEAKITAVDKGVQIRYHAESVPDSMLARMFGASFVRHEAEEQFLAMAREMVRRHEK